MSIIACVKGKKNLYIFNFFVWIFAYTQSLEINSLYIAYEFILSFFQLYNFVPTMAAF